MTRYVALFITIASLFFSVAAFSTETKKKFVVTIKPLHSLTSMAAEQLNTPSPQLLLEGNADPHHFSLKPSQARLLEEADMVLYASDQIETFLQKQIEASPLKFFPPIAFTPEDTKKYSHAWLDMKLSLKMLKAILFAYRSGKAEAADYSDRVKSKELFIIPQPIMDKFIERSNHYLTIFKPHKGRTVWFDSPVGIPFVEQFGLEGRLFKDIPNEAAKSCVVITHGKHTKIKRFAKEYGHKLIHVDLLGADIPAGSSHYFQLMDRLTQQISDCLA